MRVVVCVYESKADGQRERKYKTERCAVFGKFKGLSLFLRVYS